MSLDHRRISGENLGSLHGCLVEGDPEQRMRERRVRRRALVISIVLQSVALAALVLIPLFGKPARIDATIMPLPPYYSHAGTRHTSDPVQQHPGPPQNVCRICAPTSISPTIPTHDPPSPGGDVDEVLFPGDGPAGPGEIPGVDLRAGIKPPPRVETGTEKPDAVHRTHIDPAMLMHRVEPVYPTLPRQLGRSGRVELRAIIATDGTIQSLQVVGGDPLFYQSALEAVRQWRYIPTVLNGRRVEVDTYITVIYNIQR